MKRKLTLTLDNAKFNRLIEVLDTDNYCPSAFGLSNNGCKSSNCNKCFRTALLEKAEEIHD